MKKLITGIAAGLVLLLAVGTSAFASTNSNAEVGKKPFQGTYDGIILGDNGSKAPLTLELSQSGELVYGTVFLDRGLYVNAGRCGGTQIPATVQTAEGTVSSKNPRLLEASTRVSVGGFNITLDLDGMISPSGDSLKTEAKIDLPWLCGRDPVISGTLYKA